MTVVLCNAGPLMALGKLNRLGLLVDNSQLLQVKYSPISGP